jgi:predicted amino acid dehydrogenase
LGHPLEAIGNFFTRFAKNKFEQKFWMYLFYPYIILYTIYVNILERIGFHIEENFDLIDKSTSKSQHQQRQDTERTLHGSTWVIHNMAAMYLVPSMKSLINERIEEAILTASKQGVKVVVLGNFNKAEWMNHGGSDIVKKLEGKLGETKTVISHGDTLSAAVILQYVLMLKQEGHWNKSVMVTGSTSKIGRALCLSLANLSIPVKMFSQSKTRFDEIASELPENSVARSCLQFTSNLKEGSECDLWLTGKMIPSGNELLTAIPDNATIVNFSVPDPLTPELLALRPDLLHLDSGLLGYDEQVMKPEFTWLLPKGTIYACLAGGIVHSALGWEKHEVGAVHVDEMQKYWDEALKVGFKLPPHSSFHEPTTLPPPKHLPLSDIRCE